MNVQLLRFDPPLEQAPDQIAERPPDAVSVTDDPTPNDAEPLLPTRTFSPAGFDVTRDPLRPLAVSVTVAVCDGGGGGGGGESGVTVSCADCVTPPPVTEIVTIVSVATCDVKTLKPPAVVPLGTTTLPLTLATAGLLLVNWNVVSVACADPIVTRPNELPPVPTVDVGLSVSPVGAGCGVSVTLPCLLTPFHVAVTVAVVFAVTPLVGSENEVEKLPGFTNTDAGGCTAGELLDSITVAPPEGACPLSITIAPAVAPPLIVLGEMVSDFSADSPTVSWPAAEAPFNVAVIVAGVAAAT